MLKKKKAVHLAAIQNRDEGLRKLPGQKCKKGILIVTREVVEGDE